MITYCLCCFVIPYYNYSIIYPKTRPATAQEHCRAPEPLPWWVRKRVLEEVQLHRDACVFRRRNVYQNVVMTHFKPLASWDPDKILSTPGAIIVSGDVVQHTKGAASRILMSSSTITCPWWCWAFLHALHVACMTGPQKLCQRKWL